MKKIVIFLILFSSGNIFAQSQWWPVHMDVEIPAIIEYTNYSTSTTTTDTSLIGWSPPDYVYDQLYDRHLSHQIDDSVFMSWHIYSPDDQIIHFLLDTLHKELRNFNFEFAWNRSTGDPMVYQLHSYSADDRFVFSKLDYHISNDSLFVMESGESCILKLSNAFSSYIDANFFTPPRSPSTQNGYERHSVTLLDDTSKYKCEMVFILEQPANGVSKLKRLSQSLSIFDFPPDHPIRFAFPSSSHSETLSIYDLLGRAIKQFEIPSSTSEYSIPQNQLPRGYYFARLGNVTAKFVVI